MSKDVTPATLRPSLTPFASALAGTLPRQADGLMLRVLTAEQAVEPMRQILKRIDLMEKKRVVFKDGSLGVSWYEQPSIFIQQWTNQESAIVLKEDADGPAAIEFDMRLASDAFKVVYRIGDAGAHAALLAAYWDLGLRRSVWEFHEDRTPKGYVARVQARYAAMRGVTLTITPGTGGFVNYTLTMEERPA